MISLDYDKKIRECKYSCEAWSYDSKWSQNGVKMELKFREFKVSTKITKIKTPRNFQRIRNNCTQYSLQKN